MTILTNLFLVLLLIGASGTGGYLLARSQFAATLATRILAYQTRLGRTSRALAAAKAEASALAEALAAREADLERARHRVHRYEVALFEGYSNPEPVQTHSYGQDHALQAQAAAYVQHVAGSYDDFDRSAGQPARTSHEAPRAGYSAPAARAIA